jgi:predicted type IV restriction endonuclease
VAKEAVKPSIMSTLSDDYLDGLREQMREAVGKTESRVDQPPVQEEAAVDEPEGASASSVVTTDEENQFADLVRQACVEAGEDPEMILVKDTTNYFNVSFRTPTRWFARFLVMKNRKVIVTRVPSEEARTLAPGYQIEDAPAAFGVSRVDVESVEAARELGPLLLRSLAIAK